VKRFALVLGLSVATGFGAAAQTAAPATPLAIEARAIDILQAANANGVYDRAVPQP
jgi:hypothetical protein